MAEQSADDGEVRIGKPETSAVGIPSVAVSMRYALSEMGPVRSAQTLLKVNQADGFDCPSCAWADPAVRDRKHAEFCENGAKAVAWEATRKRTDASFFAAHPVSFLREQTDHWLEANGRLTEPMYLAPDATHYVPVTWDDALKVVGVKLRSLSDPNRAVFYTSGRASNEAAFAYQLLARRFGTNNLPDCSNMCHESSGAALNQTIGIGKGQVTLEDIAGHADLTGRGEEARGADRRGQPAAGGRADPVQEPAEGRRPGRARHQARGPVPVGAGERGPGLVRRGEPGAA
jgi:anaerobic selenocysteine-containing dehydrogenase